AVPHRAAAFPRTEDLAVLIRGALPPAAYHVAIGILDAIPGLGEGRGHRHTQQQRCEESSLHDIAPVARAQKGKRLSCWPLASGLWHSPRRASRAGYRYSTSIPSRHRIVRMIALQHGRSTPGRRAMPTSISTPEVQAVFDQARAPRTLRVALGE